MLTLLGLRPSEARYTFPGSDPVEAALAPVALLDLLPEEDRPDTVIALCTQKAKQETWQLLADALSGRCAVQPLEIPDGGEQNDVNIFLDEVSDAVPEGADLTVDVTHGFRHFSFLMYTAVLYLTALRCVRIRGAYYGLLGGGADATSPFLDLEPLIQLPRWMHAIEVLRETGSALPISGLLESGEQNQIAQDIARDLRHLSEAYLSGLPLETGSRAEKSLRHRRPLGRLLRNTHRIPLSDQLTARLDKALKPKALSEGSSSDGWKGRVALSQDELKRQARIIDDLFERGHVATAIRLVNEWTVSWAIWRGGERGGWLDYERARKPAANLLAAISKVSQDSELCFSLDESQRELGFFWRDLSELRNGYAHHGMRKQLMVDDRQVAKRLDRVRAYWKETLKCLPEISLELGDSPAGSILVSPIGHRPGVLFSAVNACRAAGDEPATCIVISSPETQKHISEALSHAEYEGKVEELTLQDAFSGGKAEIARLVEQAKRHLIGADEVFVNITGGTTLMGLAAEAIASEARRFARPARRFGLIDRRTSHQQQADPYRAGEPFWLDEPEQSNYS